MGTAGITQTAGDFSEIAGISATGTGVAFGPIDVSAYKCGSMMLLGVFVGSFVVQGSNAPTGPFFTISVLNSNANTGQAGQAAATGVYYFPICYRYLQINCNSFTSGTIQAILELYTSPFAPTSPGLSVGAVVGLNAGANLIGYVLQEPGGTQIEQSATVAAAAAGTVTLAGVAGKTTYIRGFAVTSVPAIAIVSGLVTLTGLTNTMNYQYSILVTGGQLIVLFGVGVPASAQNTAIVLNFPAIVGGSASALAVWGVQI